MRLRKPDDYFTLYQAIDFQRYALKNYSFNESGITFPDDDIYNIAYKITWGRNSTDYPIYPRKGSLFNITGEATLPYSWFRGETNYSEMPGYERYRFLEYYKIKVNSSWFTEILPKLVIKSAGEFGYLGAYSQELGLPPFERFYLGGSGLQNFVLDGREVVALRGYPDNRVLPENQDRGLAGSIYNKFTLELRYLITENPSAQIFTLGFLEAGNSYSNFDNYEPFKLKRSAGFGVRIFMPMFGLLGVDFGYGFDNLPGAVEPSGWNTHFIIGQQF